MLAMRLGKLLKEQEEQIKNRDESLEKAREEIKWLRGMLKEREMIVRCEKCIYGDDFDCPAPLPKGYICQKGHGPHTGDWYCADGERRTDDGKS